ncbi:MAG: phytoene desaturase family protein [Desulfitobacteriaceae bacterium]
MANKKLLIIGGGIAGLTAGCYGQMNGYETEIFEMHNLPGGLCTGWKRQGYTFDGCIHWLVGSNPQSRFHDFWMDIGALDGQTIINHDEYIRVVDGQGRTCILYSDLNKLEKHFLELSPVDEPMIRDFIRIVRRFAKFPNLIDTPQELYGIVDLLKAVKMVPFLKDLIKFNKMSVAEFAEQFQDPLIRDTLVRAMLPNTKALYLLFTLAWFHNRDAGFPQGGSLEFAQSIARKYQQLGGRIHYKNKVEKIIVKDHKAVGLRLADGTEHTGDFIFSATHGYATMFKLLDGQYIDEKLKGYYEKLPTMTSVQVSLGVDYNLTGEPHALVRTLQVPVNLGGTVIEAVSLKHYCYDPGFAPKGKSVVVSLIEVPFDYWHQLSDNPEAYQAEKQRLADLVIEELAAQYPGTKGKVEVVDVATPMTFVRYTDAYKGAYMSWLLPPEVKSLRVPRTLTGLSNLFMIGQWTNPPGGLPTALLTGRWAVQVLCRQDHRTFTTRVN